MTARREKSKSQPPQLNSQLMAAKEKVRDDNQQKTRKEKLSNYLIDISKYVMTGVVIASLFKDFDGNRFLIYVVGLFIAFMALGVGLVLTDKKQNKEK